MKKSIAILMAMALVGTSAFAEVSVGAWGRGGFIFAASDNSKATDGAISNGAIPNWGGNDSTGSCIGFSLSASSDNVGFDLALAGNGTKLDNDGTAKIWVKPAEMIKFQVGQIKGDELRGKVGASDGMTNSQGEEDEIFKRFNPQHGVELDLTPFEGLYLGAALDLQTYETTTETPTGKFYATDATASTGFVEVIDSKTETHFDTAAASFYAIQAGAGYTIKNIGTLRAQYIGSAKSWNAKYIQGAFAFTGMEGLVIDAGVKYQLTKDVKEQTMVVLGANYGKGILSSTTRLMTKFGDDGADKNTFFGIWEDLNVKVAAPLYLGSEVSYSALKDANKCELFPYAKLGYDAGYIKAGFVYKMDMTSGANVNSWSIPLILQYSF